MEVARMRVEEDLGSPGITVGVNESREIVLHFTHYQRPVVTTRMNLDTARWLAAELLSAADRAEKKT